ncbi:class 1 fructose-bisphosphatase [bacterium]|nr:class 1 fructose-bisphosphatase [bacterium]
MSQRQDIIVTVQQHIQEQQHLHAPKATGEFSWLLSGITLATKMIQAKVRSAGLNDIVGSAGATNVQGETQQKLDIYANKVLLHCLGVRDSVGILASEENEDPVLLKRSPGVGKYAVVFDPLDGSSNIDVNVSVGTIFSVLRRHDPDIDSGHEEVLQPGHEQVAAGYVLYGASTVLVYTAGNGVHLFTLDPSIGAFILSQENLRMPDQGIYYSVNEAYRDAFPEEYLRYLQLLRQGKIGHGKKYASRYVGSLVADFHRTLLKGGVFLYPPTASHAQGKLRLLYEANPIAFIAEQAGGMATNGKERILDIVPKSVHQRTPLVVGGRTEMTEFERVSGEVRKNPTQCATALAD